MAEYYFPSDLEAPWAGDWIYSVFKGYLKVFGAEEAQWHIQEVAIEAEIVGRFLDVYCKTAAVHLGPKLNCGLVDGENVGTAASGLLHFIFELDPQFHKATEKMVKKARNRSGSLVGNLRDVIEDIRGQHQGLFCQAVIPGFHVVEDAGEITEEMETIAIAAVPVAAIPTPRPRRWSW